VFPVWLPKQCGTHKQPHHYHLHSSGLRPSRSCVPIPPEIWQYCMVTTFQHSWLMTGRHLSKGPIRYLKTKLPKQEEEKSSTATICNAMQWREWVWECLWLRDVPQPAVPSLGSGVWAIDGKVQVSIAINMKENRNSPLLYRRDLSRNLPYGFTFSQVQVGLVQEQVILGLHFFSEYSGFRRSQWPRGLRRGSGAARLLRLWVRIPQGAWMFVCCECCVCCQVEVSARIW
jgi:hypothetical protein